MKGRDRSLFRRLWARAVQRVVRRKANTERQDLEIDSVLHTPQGICFIQAKYGPTLVDGDPIQPSNLNRVLGTTELKSELPRNAEFLFYLFLDAERCDALAGDLEERHKLIRRKFGVRRANFWYWTQAIRSVGPIACAWIKKAALKPVLAISTWLLTHGLLDGSLHEWVKNIFAGLTKRIRG